MNDGFLAASNKKGPSVINRLRNIGSHASFISRSHLECARFGVERINHGDINEAHQSQGDLQHAFAFHDDLLLRKLPPRRSW